MNPILSPYSEEFFKSRTDSLRSAYAIVPILCSLIKPESVLDVGCGTGAFLKVFLERGVRETCGIDGPWVPASERLIQQECFLEKDLSRPFTLARHFDLVLSLEVAEHIEPDCARTFVKNLVTHGDVIAFSAAIPHQGGTHHVNEQWPSYWAALFKECGYVPVDSLRKRFWNMPEVSFWYAQNMLFFVRCEALPKYPLLSAVDTEQDGLLPLVHPVLFETRVRKAELFDRYARFIPRTLIEKLFGF